MKIRAAHALVLCTLVSWSGISHAEELSPAALSEKIKALDAEVFKAFNECDMAKFATFFTPDVEFYHDLGGVTWSRSEVIANTQKNICGKRRRERIEDSIEVFPIKDFGAVELGTHRFCDLNGPKCEGIGRFVHIWQNDGGGWKLTRVISYDHRSMPK
jgi:ketosteroid isomerase-like protein